MERYDPVIYKLLEMQKNLILTSHLLLLSSQDSSPEHSDFCYMKVTVNADSVNMTSSFIWLQAGYSASITISGKAVVHGGEFKLNKPPGAQFTSSYGAIKYRVYSAADAIANRNNATFEPDPHQRDGDLDSNCFDFVYASRTRVDPPAVTVLACNSTGSWVSDHFHPWGATYIPLSGDACFNTPDQHCISPGNCAPPQP